MVKVYLCIYKDGTPHIQLPVKIKRKKKYFTNTFKYMFTQSINRMEENITLLDDNENIRVWKGLKEGVRKALDDYNADKHKDQHLGVSALYRIAVIEKLEQLKLNKYIK